MAAAGQIGAANASVEDDITAESHFFGEAAEYHVPKRMARGVAHFELELAKLEFAAMLQFFSGVWAGIDIHAKEGRPALHAPQR